MTALAESIEVSRRPEDVFQYATDPAHLPKWQMSVVSVRKTEEGPAHVGSRAVVRRRVGRLVVDATTEVAELSPPRSWEFRGTNGPVRIIEKGKIEPLDEGKRSRVTIMLDFEPHGVGRLLLPLVVRPAARRQLPANEEKLKELLESDASLLRPVPGM